MVRTLHKLFVSDFFTWKYFTVLLPPAQPTKGQYVSTYFAVPKSKRTPDKWRPILNLKQFNKSVRHVCFKMEEIKAVRKWFWKGAWCAGLDLKDAFLHVPMHLKARKFLRFK